MFAVREKTPRTGTPPFLVGLATLGALLVAACGGLDSMAPGSESEAAQSIEPSATTDARAGYVPASSPVDSEAPPFSALKVVNDEAFDAMYFDHYGVNPTIDTSEEKCSTFSVDVDTASYAVARAYLQRGHLPPEAAVRVEEFVNAIDYHYDPPGDQDFHLNAEAVPSPSRPGYHLLHLGLKGRTIPDELRRPAQLVFVIDVSGSMNRENRLGLVKRSLRILLDHLNEGDEVGLVVYGSRGQVILEPTGVEHRPRILAAIDELQPDGSTNAQEGLELGYEMAAEHFLKGGINRLILCSDGVANNGISTSAEGIFDTVAAEVEKGITISTVGFGMGNYNDVLMERLAQKGHGNYHYVDSDAAAARLFGEDLTRTLEVIAKDVKIQVEFDPAVVSRFRLLGYENRRLKTEDFEDDFVPAGYVGPGHAVTALYEIKFTGAAENFGTVRVRHKPIDSDESRLIERALPFSIVRDEFTAGSAPLCCSAVVALFAEKLRGSYWVRTVEWAQIEGLYHRAVPAEMKRLADVAELGQLIRTAQGLDSRPDRFAANLPVTEMDFDRVPTLR